MPGPEYPQDWFMPDGSINPKYWTKDARLEKGGFLTALGEAIQAQMVAAGRQAGDPGNVQAPRDPITGLTTYEKAQLDNSRRGQDATSGNNYADNIAAGQRNDANNAATWQRFVETMGMDKAKLNNEAAAADAKQKWQEAIDRRDFTAAEHWKTEANNLAYMNARTAQQNDFSSLAQRYNESLLAAKKGPQDWASYWSQKRGFAPPAGAGTPDPLVNPFGSPPPSWLAYPTGGAGGVGGGTGGTGGGTGGLPGGPGGAPGGPSGAVAPGGNQIEYTNRQNAATPGATVGSGVMPPPPGGDLGGGWRRAADGGFVGPNGQKLDAGGHTPDWLTNPIYKGLPGQPGVTPVGARPVVPPPAAAGMSGAPNGFAELPKGVLTVNPFASLAPARPVVAAGAPAAAPSWMVPQVGDAFAAQKAAGQAPIPVANSTAPIGATMAGMQNFGGDRGWDYAPGTPYESQKPNNLGGGKETLRYEHGGQLRAEPISGVGEWTGRPYSFNEDPSHPETVVAEGQSLEEARRRRGVGGAFATGGLLGYANDGMNVAPRLPFYNWLQGGEQPARAFNTFAGTGVDNGNAWSEQAYRGLAPTEQQGAQGYARDVQGVDPTDALSQMARLAPGQQASRPKWSWL